MRARRAFEVLGWRRDEVGIAHGALHRSYVTGKSAAGSQPPTPAGYALGR
jgi:hypothetical protein